MTQAKPKGYLSLLDGWAPGALEEYMDLPPDQDLLDEIEGTHVTDDRNAKALREVARRMRRQESAQISPPALPEATRTDERRKHGQISPFQRRKGR